MPRDPPSASVRWMHRALLRRYGPQGWWPGEGHLEIVVGAILTQNTGWRNVEKAIAGLKAARFLSLRRLATAPRSRLETAIRASGFYRQKAQRVQHLARHVLSRHGSLGAFLRQPTARLREELLSLPGIGPETADSILCYAARRPVFVVDAYARRLCERLPLPAGEDYDDVQAYVAGRLPLTQSVLGEAHALIVRVAKEHCRATPACDGCPLRPRCATGGSQLGEGGRPPPARASGGSLEGS